MSEEIIGAASRLFARRGVAATTMAEIADASGLKVSSLYYYFGSKHAIVERIVADANRVPLEAIEEAIAAHPDAATRLHAFIRADAAALCDFPFDINEIHRIAGDDDEGLFGRYWADRQRLSDGVEAMVAAAVADGTFIDVDPHLAALTILANDEAAQNWFRAAGPRRGVHAPSEVGRFLADLALRGLLADPAALDAIRAATDR